MGAVFTFGDLGVASPIPVRGDPEFVIYFAWLQSMNDPTVPKRPYDDFKDDYCVQTRNCVKRSDGSWTLTQVVTLRSAIDAVQAKKLGQNWQSPEWVAQVAQEKQLKDQLAVLKAQLAAAQAAAGGKREASGTPGGGQGVSMPPGGSQGASGMSWLPYVAIGGAGLLAFLAFRRKQQKQV